jgi:hypothetical protein
VFSPLSPNWTGGVLSSRAMSVRLSVCRHVRLSAVNFSFLLDSSSTLHLNDKVSWACQIASYSVASICLSVCDVCESGTFLNDKGRPFSLISWLSTSRPTWGIASLRQTTDFTQDTWLLERVENNTIRAIHTSFAWWCSLHNVVCRSMAIDARCVASPSNVPFSWWLS